MPTLVLLRHGQSQWNLENRFTGWWDVDLSERGIAEARAAGRLLRDKGMDFDCCFTSVLTRAIRTLFGWKLTAASMQVYALAMVMTGAKSFISTVLFFTRCGVVTSVVEIV